MLPTPLHYVCFDRSDDGLGHSTLDALASVTPALLSAVQAEAQHIIAWVQASFGEPQHADDVQDNQHMDTASGWCYELSTYEETVPHGTTRAVLSLTISAPSDWCDALCAAWMSEDD